MKEKPPAFQFYPKDFISDANVALMSLAEKGAYIMLLSHCWLHGHIPNDPVRASRLVGATAREMKECWPAVYACFEESPNEPLRLIHRRLEKERNKQREYLAKSSEGGKKSAEKRKVKLNPPSLQVSTKTQPPLVPNPQPNFNSPSPSPSPSPETTSSSVRKPDDDDTAVDAVPHHDGPIETIGLWLEQYVGKFGKDMGHPSEKICFSVFRALNGASLDDLEQFLIELFKKGQVPSTSYAWFTTVVSERFARRANAART